MKRVRAIIVGVGLIAGLLPMAGMAEEAVSVGGALALLNKAGGSRAGVVLIPGGDGTLNIQPDGTFARLRGNQLVRTRAAYPRQGITSLTIDRGVDPASAVQFLRRMVRTVVVVGTSRGTLRIPDALSAKPAGIVLTSGFLDDVKSSIGNPAALPRTLVVEHRNDSCRFTLPANVEPFKAWGGAKVQVVWLDGGKSVGNPCGGSAHHGFNGIDGAVVSAVARFVGSLR
jgi:hypothetical protein